MLPPRRLTLPQATRIPTDEPTYSYKRFNLLQQLQQIDFWAESGLLENFQKEHKQHRQNPREKQALFREAGSYTGLSVKLKTWMEKIMHNSGSVCLRENDIASHAAMN